MSPESFERLASDALKSIGKTLGQMALYRAGHPAVQLTIQEALRQLTDLLAQAEAGEAAFSTDQDKLIANGRIVSHLSLVPNAVVQMFSRFRLNSVTFRAGLVESELIALCEMASMKPDQAKAVDAAAYLSEHGVSHIGLNEAIYAKVEKAAPGAPPPVETGAAAPAAAPAPESDALKPEVLAQLPLEDSLHSLVRAAVPDPRLQEAVYRAVLSQITADIERRVREATEGLRREKTTLENEASRTQAVLGGVAEGVIVVDEEGKVLMMNPAAEALHGVKLAEAAGKPLAQAVKDEHILSLAREMTVPQDKPLEAGVAVAGPSADSRKTLRAAAAVVQNEAGKTVGMVSALTDVVKHKELQRMEREFIAHVTHELRAPLSSIRAALEILQGQFGGRLDADELKMFTTALKNTDRLEGMVSSILDFSKLESGQMTVHPKPSDAAAMAGEGAESLRPWCEKKKIALAVEAPAGLPQVWADQPRVAQVLVNLVSNAVKFTPAGGRITVRVLPGYGRDEGHIVFSVSDTGSGIDPKDHQKIFEKFVQIAAGERHVGGTGLGLAIAKSLVVLHKGRMWVESEPGKGATFLFTLPQYHPPIDTTPPPPRPRPWWKKLFRLG